MANLVTKQDEEETPELTLKGYSEIVAGTTDHSKAPATMTAGGYLMPNYSKGAQEQKRTPALIVEDPDMSGGATTLNQALYSRTNQGFEDFAQSRNVASMLIESANLPDSYKTSSKKDAIKNFLPDLVAGASETVVSTISGIADGRYLNALKESSVESRWQGLVAEAYAEDPELKEKMKGLRYKVDAGGNEFGHDEEGNFYESVGLDDMSYDDLAYAKMDRWVNADGSPLTDAQKNLLQEYQDLNIERVADRQYRQYTLHFGKEMADRFGLHKTTKADLDTAAYMAARIGGDVVGSGLIYGYVGAGIAYLGAKGATALTPAAKFATKRKYYEEALNIAKSEVERHGYLSAGTIKDINSAAKSIARKQYVAHANWTVPLNTALSGLSGSKFVFGTSFFRQYYDIRNQALMQGWTFNDANNLATWAGIGEATLDVVKFNAVTKKFLSSNPNFWNFLMYSVVPEGAQEGAQTATENFFTQSFGLTDKEFRDIAAEVILAVGAGAIGGAAFGSIHYKLNTTEAAIQAIQNKYQKMVKGQQEAPDAWAEAAKPESAEPSASDLKENNFNPKPPEPPDGGAAGAATETQEQPTEPTEPAAPAKEDWSKAVEQVSKKEGESLSPKNENTSDKPMLKADIGGKETNFKDDGTEKNAEGKTLYRFATSELTDPATGKVVGMKGVLVDPETKEKVGDYERYTAPVRPYVKDSLKAQDMANSEEFVLNKARKVFEVRAKAVNPKVTKEQLDRAWRAVRVAAQHELHTNDFSKSVSDAINRVVESTAKESERFKTNIEMLNGRLGQDLPQEDRNDLLSDDYNVRYQAQWRVIKRGITRMFVENGMTKTDGEEVANAFESMFSDMLLVDSNISPIDFYNMVKPKVISFARAQANGQKVTGMHTLFDEVANRVEQLNPSQAYDISYNTLVLFELYRNAGTEKERRMYENEIKQTFFGAKANDYTVEDIEAAISAKADIEEVAAWNMGLNIGTDFQFDKASYHIMAIMRSMGFNQAQINEAFGLKPRQDAEADYARALNDATYDDDGDVILNAAAPRLTKEEITDLEHILRMAKKDQKQNGKEYTPARGVYDPNTNTIAMFNAQEGANEGASRAGLEEGMHWVYNVARAVANSSVIPSEQMTEKLQAQNEKKYGSQYMISLDPHRGNEVLVRDPEVNNPGIVFPMFMAQRLNQSIRDVIRARRGSKYNITPRDIEETLVDAYNRWTADSTSVPRGIATDLTGMTNIMNQQFATNPDSLIGTKKIAKSSEEGLQKGVKEAFSQGPITKLAYAANELNDAINNAKDKKELGRAILKALNENPNVPFELTTPIAVEMAIAAPEEMSPLWAMQAMAERVKNNMREQVLRMAFEEAAKGSSFDPELASESDYDTDEEMPLLYSRDGKAIEQPALTNYDIKRRNAVTKKMFSWNAITKAAKDISESIAHAALKLNKQVAAVIQRTSYEHTLREFQNQLLVDRLYDLWMTHDNNAKNGKGGTIITVQKAQKFYDILGTMGEGTLKNGKPRPTREDSIEAFKQLFDASEEEKARAEQLLRELYKAFDNALVGLTNRGVKLAAIKEFFPRSVWNREGLADFLSHPGLRADLAVKVQEWKKAGKSNVEIINLINQQFRKNPGDNGSNEVEMFHHRVFKDVTGEMWKYYDHPFDAALKYLNSASRTMMMRDLFGDVQYSEVEKGKKIPDYSRTGRVGTALKHTIDGDYGKYVAKDLQNFITRMKELQSRHGDDSENFWATIKALQGVFALGGFRSTLNQYLELVPTLYRYGLTDVAQAVIEILKDKNAVDIAKIGLRPLNEGQRITEDKGWFSVAQKKILQITRFEKADVFLKNIVLNAALIRAQKTLLNDGMTGEVNSDFNKDFDEAFPIPLYSEEQRAKIREDIKNGNITEDVGLFLRNQLAKTQPIDSFEIPAGYLGAGPLGQNMYYLRTTLLKQFEYFTHDLAERARNAKDKAAAAREVAKQLARLFIFAALIGMPVEALAAIIVFKKPDPARAAIFTPLQFFLMNEYMMSQVPKKGLGSAMLGQIAPGFKVMDDLTTGRLLKSTPFLQDAAYNALGGGQAQLARHGESLLSDNVVHKKDNNFLDDLDFFGGDLF